MSGRGIAALALALGLAVASGWQLPASAHATLVASDPEEGARLDALPARVTLEFNEPMSAPAYVVVTAPDGSQVQEGEVAVDGQQVDVGVADPGTEGTYGIAFRAVSQDGHPVSGRISFVVGDGPLEEPSFAAPGDSGGAEQGSGEDSADVDGSGAGDDSGGPSLGQVQVGIGAGLFVVAAALLWWSRRRSS